MQPVSPSVARMNAKAAQLAAELAVARGEGACDKQGAGCFGGELSKDAVPSSPTATAAAGSAASTLRLGQSLAGPRRMSQANLTVKLQNTDAATLSAIAQCQKLESEVQLWKSKAGECEQELQRHQESYMRREEQMRHRMAELEQRLQQAGQEGGSTCAADSAAAAAADDEAGTDTCASADNGSSSPGGMRRPQAKAAAAQPLTLEAVQQQMQRGLEDLLQHQRLQLRAEEAAQLRQFRGRLAEVEAQLAADKRATAADQDSWMSKTVAVREELARTQEIAVKLDAMYRLAEDEAARLRVQFKAQEDDRQHLIRQVLGLRRQNKQLQQQTNALQEELDAIMALEPDADSIIADAQQQQQQQHFEHAASRRPHTAAAGVSHPHRARPMTAGPQLQQQQQGSHWRPLSGSPQHREAPSNTPAQQQCSERALQQLQRALQCERKQLRQLRAAYTAELGRRSELQTLLLDSIQHAKQQYQQAAAAAHATQLQGAEPADAVCALSQQHQQQQHRFQLQGGSSVSAGLQRRPGSSVAARPSTCSNSSSSNSSGLQPSSWGWGAWFDDSSSSPSVRPKTAVPTGAAARNAAATAAPSIKGVAAAGDAAGARLDGAAWARLLQELLSRQQLLEGLLQRAFPDFVAAAQQLHQQGHHGSAQVPGANRPDLQQQPFLSQGQQQQQQTATQLQEQQAEAAAWRPQVGQIVGGYRQQVGGSAQEEDMFAIAEMDGTSPLAGSDSDSGCELSSRESGAVSEELCGKQSADASSEQHPSQHAEQQHGQPQQAEHSHLQPQQEQPLVEHQEHQQQQPHKQQQQWWQQQLEVSPAQQRRSSSSAASPPHSPVFTAAAGAPACAAAPVTLASMSGPLLGAFPVRKLLHSGSSAAGGQRGSSNGRPTSGPQHRGQQAHARPDSAVILSRVSAGGVELGQGPTLGLRPMSAVVAAAAGAGALGTGSQLSNSWQRCSNGGSAAAPQQQLLQQQQRGSATANGSRKQQQQHPNNSSGSPKSYGPRGRSLSSGRVSREGLSITSWASSDDKAAQQMLKSFLAGQQ